MIGLLALALVLAGLALTVLAQVRPGRRHALDMLALVPEWRFYAQASLTTSTDFARDTQLVVRDRDAAGVVGGWTPVLWPGERRLVHVVWHPWMRVEQLILSFAEDLARAAGAEHVQQSVGYLVVLRRALAAPRADAAAARQFAVVHAIGRGTRTLSIDFLSGWHRW